MLKLFIKESHSIMKSNFNKLIYLRKLHVKIWLKVFMSFFISGYVISRTACLGNDSLKLLGKKPIFNFQKGRIDLLISKLQGNNVGPINNVEKYINRIDLKELILAQKKDFTKLICKASVLYMDSYSELTDQLFVHKVNANIRFNANYSDVDKKILKDYDCLGLIDRVTLNRQYDLFFNMVKELNPKINIIYIFFPIKLEKRIKFHHQNDAIKAAIYSSKDKYDISVIEIPDSIVNRHPIDGHFPYHYDSQVYNYVSEKLKLIWN